ncbi:hypothetical protein ACFYO2_42885 [Streptomyces sp. NPDC006602]|uniref:hypothetical protein n=1 Tax=Streptomyces sp. NPDC006602 TaxID=3364751 RepID=UPI00368EDCC8
MPTAERTPPSTAVKSTADRSTYPVDAVLSLGRDETSKLLRAMRSQQVLPPFCHPWGSGPAYRALLREQDALSLLDVPEGAVTDDLAQRVHVLSAFSSVVVLTPGHIDSTELLRAGAANVLPRHTPPRELAGRLTAERRWLAASAPRRGRRAPVLPRQVARPRQLSQQVLQDVLLSSVRPWCCHDLCLLLGTARAPVSRRALQARMVRLSERLMPYGLSVTSTVQWGRTVYTGIGALVLQQYFDV